MADQKRSDTVDKVRQGNEPLGTEPAVGAIERNNGGGETAVDGARATEARVGDGSYAAASGRASVRPGYTDLGPGTAATGPTRPGAMHMMESAGQIGGGAVDATRDVLRGAIGATEDVASGLVGGVSHVAADLVHGVHDVGMEVRDGASGLIGAVGDIGGTAVHTVANLLVDVVGGVRYVVGAALGQNGNGRFGAGSQAGQRFDPGAQAQRQAAGQAQFEAGEQFDAEHGTPTAATSKGRAGPAESRA